MILYTMTSSGNTLAVPRVTNSDFDMIFPISLVTNLTFHYWKIMCRGYCKRHLYETLWHSFWCYFLHK